MKRYTVKEVAEYLMRENCLEWQDGKAYYYLYYTDSQLKGSVRNNDFCAQVRARHLEALYEDLLEEARKAYYGEDCEDCEDCEKEFDEQCITEMASDKMQEVMWGTESLDNPEFMEVARELADELNDYIASEWGWTE